MAKWIRIGVLLYSGCMLAAIELVGINSGGRIELESDRRDIYAALFFVTASSFVNINSGTKI